MENRTVNPVRNSEGSQRKISNGVNIIAVFLLLVMFVTAVLSMRSDSLTFDELAHIGAGYSYLIKQDYRINPEHPPLIKDIPALPLLFLNLNFPDSSQNWLQADAPPAWWVQFDLGTEFIYRSGNNPREIIFWSRLAMIMLMVFLGWLLFWWTRRTTNSAIALGALALFAFSPTFLAHGRLVNTDVGAVLGAFLAIIFWLKFLDAPSWKNVLLAGISFGAAMLLKFSLILLIPFFAIITLLYVFLFSGSKDAKNLRSWISYISVYLGKAITAGLIGFVFVIWPVYQFHVWNYPAEQQLRDTIADISGHPVPQARKLTLWMAEKEVLRAPAQYFRGILMASQRTVWGNTAYFLGEISADSWLHYFPLLYFLKVPLAFHILTLLAIIFSFIFFRKNLRKEYFWALAFILWIAVYWSSSLFGNLNIGVRHLLPVFPFTYILVVFGIYHSPRLIKFFALLLFVWYAVSSLLAFPHYISYYNEISGGSKNGYKIAVDSNYDWGQDFYRLMDFVENPPNGEKIDKIYLDYFGGEDAEYWLGEKYVRFNPREMTEKPQGWLAISANHLIGGTAQPAEEFDQETGYYNWLLEQEPEARAGYSIFIYYLAD